MTLASGWILHFLWIVPLAGFAMIVRYRRRQRALQRFAEPALLARLTPAARSGKNVVKAVLPPAALGLLVLALAGPRWGNHYQEVSRKGVDIMVVVDVSRSMMVEDVKPNRLERARREIIDFLKVVRGDRVGLTAFAGAAFVQCPLTLDYGALELFLSALEPGIIPVPGTDLGAAIETGMSAFDFKTRTDKVMLLITDGEDNERRGLEAARKAAEKGVRIFVFGMGDPTGGPIPADNGKGGFQKDKDGKLVLSKLDEKSLREMASDTGGTYVRSTVGDLDLDTLYFDGIKRKTEAHVLKSGKIKIYEERFTVFVLAALLLLLMEGFIEPRRRPSPKKHRGRLTLLLVCTLIPVLPAAAVHAAESPDDLYHNGRYEEAEKAYTNADMDHPRDIRFRYNRGCAAFQKGRYADAAAAFSSVMKRTQDPGIQFKAAYNSGNTAFKQGNYQQAAAYYKQALAHDPFSEDARYNLELSLRAQKKMAQRKPEDAPKTDPAKPEDDKKQGDRKNRSGDRGQPENKDARKGDRKKRTDPADKGPEQAGDAAPKKSEPGPDQERSAPRAEPHPPGAGETHAGELKPMQALPELKDHPRAPKTPGSAADKRRAEALLDNVKENPAGLMDYMAPRKDRRDAGSGRDW